MARPDVERSVIRLVEERLDTGALTVPAGEAAQLVAIAKSLLVDLEVGQEALVAAERYIEGRRGRFDPVWYRDVVRQIRAARLFADSRHA